MTLLFVEFGFLLAFKLDDKTAKSVVNVFDYLFDILGAKLFKELFPVILTDNGTEFSSINGIEFGNSEWQRTKLYYCL